MSRLALAGLVAAALAGSPAPVLPPAGAGFSPQLGGAYPPPASASIVERDRADAPQRGDYNLCYVNAFQAQTAERGWWLRHHRSLLLWRGGRAVIDTGWNEQLFDTSTAPKRRALATIIGGWITGCARHGFQAIEPDNLDSWSRSQGRLSVADNLGFARLLILRAHADGLAIAQKNGAELGGRGRRLGFDFAVAEECQVYAECAIYTHAYGREVLEIEYTDNGGGSSWTAACRARGGRISIVLRDRNLLPAGTPGHVERSCPELSARSSPRSP